MPEIDRKEIEQMIASAVLTKQDIKDDIIKPLLATMGAYHEGDLKLINADLKKILVEARKHNQRMTKIEIAAIKEAEKIIALEKADLTHATDCPLAGRVRTLEDDNLTTKGIKKWMAKTVGVTAGSLTALWIIFQIAMKLIENIQL